LVVLGVPEVPKVPQVRCNGCWTFSTQPPAPTALVNPRTEPSAPTAPSARPW